MMQPDTRLVLQIILGMGFTQLALLLNIMLRLGTLTANHAALKDRVDRLEQGEKT